MSTVPEGAIDCDAHVTVPGITALLPFMSQAWREMIVTRGTDGLELASYPAGTPLSSRPDWRPSNGKPIDLPLLRRELLDGFGLRAAILNCLHGGQAVHSEDLARALCQAVNDWLVAEWLDKEPRLRASIVVPSQSPGACRRRDRSLRARPAFRAGAVAARRMKSCWAANITGRSTRRRCATVCRSAFTAAALTVTRPPRSAGRRIILQDYVSHTMGLEGALLSLMAEGVFNHFPDLRVVLIESGVSWLPGFLWRAIKSWRGLRGETPWFTRRPPTWCGAMCG